jgi:SAM-dependent methyltransferase
MFRLAATSRTLRPPPWPRVNLGCGRCRHPEWTNCDLAPDGPDVIRCDLRCPLPFPAASCEAVYAAHVLEHLAVGEARRLVAEIHRVLVPGGVVRIVVPDLEGIARAYLASLERAAAEATAPRRWEHAWMTVELLDQLVRDASGGLMRRWWSCEPVPCREFLADRLGEEATVGIAAFAAARRAGRAEPLEPEAIFDAQPAEPGAAARFAASGERHRWMYDRVSLVALLEAAGFTAVAPTTATASGITGFAAAGLDADSSGRPCKPDSLYVEGVRA